MEENKSLKVLRRTTAIEKKNKIKVLHETIITNRKYFLKIIAIFYLEQYSQKTRDAKTNTEDIPGISKKEIRSALGDTKINRASG